MRTRTRYISLVSALVRYEGWRIADGAAESFVKRVHSAPRRGLPTKSPNVIVDVSVPFSRTAEFMDWYHREIKHYPVWCVPYKRTRDYEWLTPRWWAGVHDPLFLDLAVYGLKQLRDLYTKTCRAALGLAAQTPGSGGSLH